MPIVGIEYALGDEPMTIADAGLRRIVQDNLSKGDGWLWTAVETGGTHAGVPDSFWAHEPTQTSGWVEHKATSGWAVTMRPHQIAWMERHARAGVRCHILVRAMGSGSAKKKGDSLWVIDGAAARHLAGVGLGDLPDGAVLGYWAGGPSDWDWGLVRKILTGWTGGGKRDT